MFPTGSTLRKVMQCILKASQLLGPHIFLKAIGIFWVVFFCLSMALILLFSQYYKNSPHRTPTSSLFLPYQKHDHV